MATLATGLNLPAGYSFDSTTGNITNASGVVDTALTNTNAEHTGGTLIAGYTEDQYGNITKTSDDSTGTTSADNTVLRDDSGGVIPSISSLQATAASNAAATQSTAVTAAAATSDTATAPAANSFSTGNNNDVTVINADTGAETTESVSDNSGLTPSDSSSNTLLGGIGGSTSNFVNSSVSSATNQVTGTISSLAGVSGSSTLSSATTQPAPNTYKVCLQGPGGTVYFEASAPISEERNATYQGFDITHLPAEIPAYKGTSSRKFSITGKFICRNKTEATATAGYLDLIRSWLLPDYANTGATPPILKLYGYKNDYLTGVQVILKTYSYVFPDDVDYIYTGSSPMPTISIINISVDEVFSPEQITAGNWKIKQPTVTRPPDAFGNGDAQFGASATTGGSSLGSLSLSSIIPVATALATAVKGGAAGSAALSSLAGYATSTAASLISSNPVVKSFIGDATSSIKSVVSSAGSTVQGALTSATQSVVGFTQSIGSGSSNSAVTSSMAGSGGLLSSIGNALSSAGNSVVNAGASLMPGLSFAYDPTTGKQYVPPSGSGGSDTTTTSF